MFAAIPRRGALRGLLAAALLGAAALAGLDAPALAADGAGRVVAATIHGPSLAGSRTGTDPDRPVQVYLPPDYDADPDRRYPVVYLLHGFGGSGTQWTDRRDGWSIAAAMDRLIAAGTVRPMIVVMPDAQVPLIGGMYVDSPASGNWETFLATTLVDWTDASFRTVPDRRARAIAGHSMGGYGALNAAIEHPDVFAVTYGISPCCLDWGKDLGLENPRAFGPAARFADLAAFQAGPVAYPHLAFAIASGWTPSDGFQPLTPSVVGANGSVTPNPAVKAAWEARMPVHTAAAKQDALRRLTIGIEVGSGDEYAHILAGTRALAATLQGLGIAHTFQEHDGRHGDRLVERLEGAVLPFLSARFAQSGL